MSTDSPVAVLWENLLRGALGKFDPASRRKTSARETQRTAKRQSVYACKQRPGAYWCAEPCRPEKTRVQRKVKRVTFSPVVSVVEFAVVSSAWD